MGPLKPWYDVVELSSRTMPPKADACPEKTAARLWSGLRATAEISDLDWNTSQDLVRRYAIIARLAGSPLHRVAGVNVLKSMGYSEKAPCHAIPQFGTMAQRSHGTI